MSKCPICGSNGDDLVFRFYCSNKECINFMSNKDEKSKQVEVPFVAPAHLKAFKRVCSGEFSSINESKFVGKFPSLRDHYAKEIQAQWIVNDYVVVPSVAPIPEFTLIEDRYSNSLNFVWGERIPDILGDLLAPILRSHVGKPACCDIVDMIRNDVIQYLLNLVARRQLIWSHLYRRWELYFTE
jgi:hypothetical protein